MKKTYRMIGIALGLVLIFLLVKVVEKKTNPEVVSTMVISEICDNNFSTAPLQYRENVDWIELYNASKEPLNLEGWTISDDNEDIDKYVFPDVEIKSGETLLLYATGENKVTEEGIFLNFRLSENEQLSLFNAEGKVVDSVVVPELKENTSYARKMDISQEWVEANPTPLYSNAEAAPLQTVTVEEPIFSLQGGFYNGEQVLELSVEDPGTSIFYTLDGSEPTAESYCYIEPITIYDKSSEPNVLSARGDISSDYCYRYVPEVLVDKISVVRAVAIDGEGNKSHVVTNSYIVDIQGKDTYKDMATISITAEPDEWFDYNNGLYVLGLEYIAYMEFEDESDAVEPRPNYKIEGKISEKAVNIEIYDAGNNLLLNQKVGMRIRGNTTRKLSQKSFGLYAREMYSGNNSFDTDVFGNGETYGKMRLYTDRDETKIRHELHAQLLKDRAVATLDYMRCNVFLNGEYWGVYSLGQIYDGQFIQNKYGVPADEVIIEESLMPDDFIQLLENEAGLTDEELYDKLTEMIDMDSYIDYFASMIYIDHYDWLHHNGYMWKSSKVSPDNPYRDGKWRFMLYDTETCEKHYDANTFREGIISAWHDDGIAQILMKNEDFRERFVTVFMDMANTIFEEEYVHSQMDNVLANYSQAIEAQGIRWGDDWADNVYEELDDIREFYEERLDYITGYLEEEFSIEGELKPVQLETSDAEKGVIKINTVIPEFENNQWEGCYYTDYPITLSAIENKKSSFEGWYDASGELLSKDISIVVPINSENYYKAVFK